ncbi:hypothetical protein ACIQCJ_11855 [Streptomyces sp. NPDC093221]|uniref:hypothetical protein n=1 Tax=Streptomyces sp. NPDC093221 TaxID=3366032 RepID=UPI00380D80F7
MRSTRSVPAARGAQATRRAPAGRGLPAAVGTAVTAVALALATLGACTGGGDSAGSASDQKAQLAGGGSASTVSPAPPGKYQTLPAPCTAVGQELLKSLVPAVPDVAGSESLTYDTDRRVGCSWRGTRADGTSNTLKIDLERVVSYDPAVSDEVQADLDFSNEAADASIPPLSSSATPSGQQTTATPTGGTTNGNNSTTGSGTNGGNGTSTGSATSSGTAGGGGTDLLPRRLTDVGNAAFINDVLKPHAQPPRRDVTLVFRTANVLVTVTYAESSPRGSTPPDSADLQKGAQQVAEQLLSKVKD